MISSLELARRCGISQGTVDRALHNRAGVSASTREKVLRAARRHGYRSDPAARELLTGQSRTVGAVLPAINNIFFMDLFNAVGRALAAQGLRLQLTPVENRDDFLEVLEDYAARRHRLALVIPPGDHIRVPRSLSAGIPVVSLLSPCHGAGCLFLSPDEERTGRDAVRFLRRKGHRRILHVTSSRKAYTIDARTRGCRRQCAESGLSLRVLVDLDAASLFPVLERFRPTAIFCHNDWLALRVLMLLSEKNMRAPDDISVLGVDDSPTLIAIYPGLSTMSYPVTAAVRAVMNILEGKRASLQNERYRVIERATVRNLIHD